MELKKLEQLIEIAKSKKTRRLAVAAAADKHVLQAVRDASKEGIVIPVLVGDKAKIEEISSEIGFDIASCEIHDVADPVKASIKAVSIIKEGNADVLMKGNVSTGPLLKAVLDKENGLRKGSALSHVAIYETSFYHKLIGVTDAAMNVAPDINEKVAIVKNAAEAFHKIGVKEPKIAIIGAVEVVNPKMEATVDAAMLTMMNKRKQIKNCIVDGPLAIDNAVSKEAAEHKGIVSDVAGDADILVAPDINSGNILYKTIGFLGDGLSAAIIMGAKVPIVLTSRSDSEKSKLMSIALSAAME